MMAEGDSTREINFFLATLAQKTKRNVEVLERMTNVAKLTRELREGEWTLMFDGYKNKIKSRKTALKILSKKLKKESNQTYKDIMQEYQKVVEEEVNKICEEVLSLIELLTPSISKPDADSTCAALCYKMKGKFYEYLAAITLRQGAVEKAIEAYTSAIEITTSKFIPAHPIRLEMAWELSTFYYKVVREHDRRRACEIAKKALDDAISSGPQSLNNLSEFHQKRHAHVVKHLEDKLKIWEPKKD